MKLSQSIRLKQRNMFGLLLLIHPPNFSQILRHFDSGSGVESLQLLWEEYKSPLPNSSQKFDNFIKVIKLSLTWRLGDLSTKLQPNLEVFILLTLAQSIQETSTKLQPRLDVFYHSISHDRLSKKWAVHQTPANFGGVLTQHLANTQRETETKYPKDYHQTSAKFRDIFKHSAELMWWWSVNQTSAKFRGILTAQFADIWRNLGPY